MKGIALFIIFLLPIAACAFDFQVVVPSGQTLYFDTVPGGVTVVYPHAGNISTAWNGFDKPTGALTIPSSITWQGVNYPVLSIGPGAFYSCNGITTLVVEQGVTSLGNSAFSGCTSMHSVTLPASMATIGSQTFGGCSSLSNFWIQAVTPPTTSQAAFYNTSLTVCVLYVPCESAEVYAETVPWSNFDSVVALPCAATISVGVNNGARGSATGSGTYTYGTQVALEAVPADGYAFICWNDGDTLNPRLVEATEDITFVAMFFPFVHDTIDLTPAFFRLQVLSANGDLGLGVGSATLPEGTLAEICALPFDGGQFTGWSDGSTDNPRSVTVAEDMTLTAFFDTRVGVSSPEADKWSVSVERQVLTVMCPEGKKVTVYDLGGRAVATAAVASSPACFALPTGVYVVSVEGLGARKVVVE